MGVGKEEEHVGFLLRSREEPRGEQKEGGQTSRQRVPSRSRWIDWPGNRGER
jgi:hypothetical protein